MSEFSLTMWPFEVKRFEMPLLRPGSCRGGHPAVIAGPMRTRSTRSIIPHWGTFSASALALVAMLLTANTAAAQEDSYYDAANASPSSSSGSSSGRSSGGKASGLFVGAETILLAPSLGAIAPGGALAVGWDATQWRAEGLIGLLFRDGPGNNTTFSFGGRGFYALHKTSFADFSIGGLLGLIVGGGAIFLIEPSVQIRAFIVQNVAITATLGMGIAVGDTPATIGILGQINGALGVTYTFD